MRCSHGLIDQVLLRTAHDSCLLFIEKDLGSRTRLIGRMVQGGKTFCASFCASLIASQGGLFCVCAFCVLTVLVCLFVTERVLTKTEWNAQGLNVCFSKSLLTFVWLLFFVTWKNYFGLGTTNVKGKMDNAVSLRWNKEFWTFPKRRVFFWLLIRFICE